MRFRPIWKGFLRLSLVSVPVEAYAVMATGDGEIHLNQLHEECHNRIKYQKVCPVHGEVANNEIVLGYQYEKEKYVEIEQAEKERARTKSDKIVEIEKFLPLSAVDPLYFEGRNYYLLPDGAGGEHPYALLYSAMEGEKRCAFAQVALNGRDQLVLVRPKDSLLVMQVLSFETRLKDEGEFEAEAPHIKLKAEELRLAKSLVKGTSVDKIDLSKYHDSYTDKLREIIEAKVEGHKVISPPEEQAPPVINLMDALKKSLKHKARPPAKRMSIRRKKKSS